ncbi:hypothetical protein ETD86_36990 [Nonomuraea turkmeniaca]|uniref:Uncharacterized protein n=1 Tax=Nonomuraea turkmeniaca TaxID=103838 RepID=A0A5S4F554_9ACTN|nr:hypothetical protein [Nonomuraea turkmeniaca]TMR11044.1 hypothetical protein ETD86_36990 [Nonomuraea turkmeniaca]
MDHKHDVVGYAEIIERAKEDFGADFPMSTVRNWEKYRRAWVAKGSPTRSGLRPRETPMPEPVATVNGVPGWCWREIHAWLIASHRVTEPAGE